MRLRNVKDSKDIVSNSKYIVNNYFEYIRNWKEIFNNENPIHLEIGMGKGKYLLNSAIKNPNINYIGIEKYDSVLVRAIKKIDIVELKNLRIISCDAIDLDKIFCKEIDTIHLNFSDPWHKDRHSKRRLTSHVFLEIYDKVFKENCNIIMKTDNMNLFEYSIESLSEYGYKICNVSLDLHNSKNKDIITTEYEDKFVEENKNIYMLNASK